jgi:hypothetical protein
MHRSEGEIHRNELQYPSTSSNSCEWIGIKSIHIKWMNEIMKEYISYKIIKEYIRQTNCKIVVNKLQKVLTYVICQKMDEKPHWHFVCHIGMCVRT